MLLVATTAPALAHAEPGAKLSIVKRARVGAEVRVDGAGLPRGSLANAVVCGNLGLRGTPDCSLASTVEVGISDEGTFSVPMRLVAPPSPCPCAVVVSGATTTPLVRRIKLIGHPVDLSARDATAVRGGAPDIEVMSARLSGASSLGTWFGLPGESVMRLRLVNNGTRAATPHLDVGWGASIGAATRWVSVPTAPIVAPGESTTLEVPVTFDALGNGEQVVAGTVRAGGNESTFDDVVTVRPWGLFALGLLLVLLAPLALLARLARRQRTRQDYSHDPPAEEVLGVPMFEM